jgi:hypothetical protein
LSLYFVHFKHPPTPELFRWSTLTNVSPCPCHPKVCPIPACPIMPLRSDRALRCNEAMNSFDVLSKMFAIFPLRFRIPWWLRT